MAKKRKGLAGWVHTDTDARSCPGEWGGVATPYEVQDVTLRIAYANPGHAPAVWDWPELLDLPGRDHVKLLEARTP